MWACLVARQRSLPAGNLGVLVDSLSSEPLLGDESLDLGRLVEGLVALLDLSSNDVLGDIVLLSQSEGLSDLVDSLRSESSWLVIVGEALNFTWSLLENLKGNDTEVWAANATSNRLSLALTRSFGSVRSHS